MAIAYFIPDQAKLLARSASNQHSQTNSNSGGAAVNSNQSCNTTTTTAPSVPQQQQQQQPPQQSHHNNHHFRANITIPLNAHATPQTSLGCWELITHAFCCALRCYHETARLRPAVIEITFEISGGGNSENVATPSATQQQAPTTTGQERNANGAPNKN